MSDLFVSSSMVGNEVWDDDPLNFKIVAVDQFPRIRELSLDGYDFGKFRLAPERIRWYRAKWS